MKVKVIKAESYNWYKDCVGVIFDVTHSPVYRQYDVTPYKSINEIHCEVIEEENVMNINELQKFTETNQDYKISIDSGWFNIYSKKNQENFNFSSIESFIKKIQSLQIGNMKSKIQKLIEDEEVLSKIAEILIEKGVLK